MGLKRSLSKQRKKRNTNNNSKKRAKHLIGGAPTDAISLTQKNLDISKNVYKIEKWVPQSEKPDKGERLNNKHKELVSYLSTFESSGNSYTFQNHSKIELKEQKNGYGLFVESATNWVPTIDMSDRLISIGGEYFNDSGKAIQKISALRSGQQPQQPIPLNFYTTFDVILNISNYIPKKGPFNIGFENHNQGIEIKTIDNIKDYFGFKGDVIAEDNDLITEINGKFFNNHEEAIKEIEPFMKVLREKRELYDEIYPQNGGSNDSDEEEYSSDEEEYSSDEEEYSSDEEEYSGAIGGIMGPGEAFGKGAAFGKKAGLVAKRAAWKGLKTGAVAMGTGAVATGLGIGEGTIATIEGLKESGTQAVTSYTESDAQRKTYELAEELLKKNPGALENTAKNAALATYTPLSSEEKISVIKKMGRTRRKSTR
jgi:hypothetical protein